MNTYIKSIGFVLQVVYKMLEWDPQSSRVVRFSWFLGPHLYACLPLSDIYTYKTIEFTKQSQFEMISSLKMSNFVPTDQKID